MSASNQEEVCRVVGELLDLAKADTAFADLFLGRARELMILELTEEQHAALSGLDDEVAGLTNQVASAMETEDWPQVRELTSRLTALKRTVSERAEIRGLASRLYGFDDILVDPFSPGIAALAGVPERELPSFRDAAVKRLERLRGADPGWADLYEARRQALSALQLASASALEEGAPTKSVAGLRARAQKALAEGDLAQLEQLSTQIMEAESREGTAGGPGGARGGAGHAEGPTGDLTEPFAREVTERAGKLGLTPQRIESTYEQIRAKYRPAWRPTLSDASGNTVRLAVTVPSDASEAVRDTLGMIMNRAFVTSAGTRYMPWFVAEDMLVEDFEDPPADASPTSPLLDALGLPGRKGLSRKRIEKALRERGAAVVKGLGLDPRTHRIACIPIDAYTRLGAKRGWGKQETWTHFDGFMVSKERKLMALVGGDARFGGLNDLVAVGADYDSDRLFARFALVQRRRFATW